MSLMTDLGRRVRELYEGARMLVEIVTDVDLDGFGVGTASGADDQEIDVEVLGAYGFRSRPRKGSAGGVVLRLFDDPDTVFLLGYGNREWELTSLKEGEAIAEADTGAKILLVNNGDVLVNAATPNAENPYAPAQPRDIILNGGTTKVALVAGGVKIGTLTGQAPFGGGAVTFTFTPADADGNPILVPPPTPGPTATLVGRIANADGAPHVLG